MTVRFVLDTDTVVAAMRSPSGASAELLRRARKAEVTLLASAPLMLEYEAVCSRPEHIAASGLDPAEVQVYLDAVAALVEPVETWFLWRPRLRDPGDELVLEAAVNGRADALVTFNVRHFAPAAGLFGLPVLLPRDALARLR
ncbi:MAG TPA: putative toxin-antitoxin system toxin component, PIN family [Azospirillaceae bacterium]|nr:putative toxin-antitoxin system toxin component, PIN family [Azospirillaceae bacterium]